MAVLHLKPKHRVRIAILVTLGAFGLSGGLLHANQTTPDLRGPIHVIDGDTFEVAGTKVRLHAIDAPETEQTCETPRGEAWACGGWITKVVQDRYSGQMASCEALDVDRYGRTVARCTALGEDVGAWLVREGMAFAYVKYGKDYAEIEREAALADRGLHAVRMKTPAQHRADKRRVVSKPRADGCVIKGNINAKGVRIYHVPGQRYYDLTGIKEKAGERWFCSEAAARAAGWRKSRV